MAAAVSAVFDAARAIPVDGTRHDTATAMDRLGSERKPSAPRCRWRWRSARAVQAALDVAVFYACDGRQRRTVGRGVPRRDLDSGSRGSDSSCGSSPRRHEERE